MFRKILVANRGEVALRIIRACRELGIRTVAIHSDVDSDSLHVRFADEDICIGPADSASSYLNIPAIISAAEVSDAEAIHPGYGFLAENAHFAEICESCQIKFIGPSVEHIRLMGDKARARKLAQKVGVPVLPGSGPIQSVEEGREVAHKIGYPVIIKAAGGGGGKGMRIVHTDASFMNAFMMAQAESKAAFDLPDVYIEKYLEEPKHVEVQLLGDEQGNIVHFGERDCSIQRRYQKLIEESPCSAVAEDLRRRLGEAALRLAREIGYFSAGTVEFLLDGKDFYFMEMNTRIQVEHPVTEMVTGVDLIKEQIRVAAGERLRFSQEDISLRGHAIECRINAEDPESFMPSPGKITGFNLPGGLGVRVDTAAYSGYTVPPYYDSLIAKLIVWGEDRQEAISRLVRALDEFVVEGIKTTVPLYRRICRQVRFLRGDFTTRFLENMLNGR